MRLSFFFPAFFAIFGLTFFYIADFLFWLLILFNELSDSFEYDSKLFIVLFFHRFDFDFEVFVRDSHYPELVKNSHYLYIYVYRAFAPEYARQHCNALFGESHRFVS
jgi:hypothetical protein